MDRSQKSLFTFWNGKNKAQNDSKKEVPYGWHWDEDLDDEILNSAYEQSIK